MPVRGEPETAGFTRVPGVGLGRHDTGRIVEEEVDGIQAVVGVDGEGEVAGGVEAVEVGDVW